MPPVGMCFLSTHNKHNHIMYLYITVHLLFILLSIYLFYFGHILFRYFCLALTWHLYCQVVCDLIYNFVNHVFITRVVVYIYIYMFIRVLYIRVSSYSLTICMSSLLIRIRHQQTVYEILFILCALLCRCPYNIVCVILYICVWTYIMSSLSS